MPRERDATSWLRENPHRIHLGMIGLQILKEDGSEITIRDINENVQKLNLWTGEIESRFKVEGVPVLVTTVCHPDKEMIAARIESELIKAPKNRYLLNGHNYQNPRLALYLLGNGGLLTAVAKMCVSGQFPHNDKWKVRWENLNEYVE